ncbi:MAG: hypothetical protein WBX11_04525 [Thiobacillaceae bacterium]
MDKQERRAYLEAIRTRYWRARKSGETAILDKFCAVPDYPHKYALRLLRASGKQSRSAARKPGRASRHAVPELVEALRTIWLADRQQAGTPGETTWFALHIFKKRVLKAPRLGIISPHNLQYQNTRSILR